MLNYSILVNAILVILLVHILLNTMDMRRDSMRPWENYENEDENKKGCKKSSVESLQFLTGESKKNGKKYESVYDASRDPSGRDQTRVLANVKEVDIPKASIPPLMPEPRNLYDEPLDMVEKPNFESNILDYRSHYSIRNDMIPEVPKYGGEGEGKNLLPKLSQKGTPTPFPAADNGKNFHRPASNLPSRWEYANELAMNGGLFGGRFHGVDSTESLYAPYQAKSISLNKCGRESVANIPHNDLRKPVVVN